MDVWTEIRTNGWMERLDRWRGGRKDGLAKQNEKIKNYRGGENDRQTINLENIHSLSICDVGHERKEAK